MKSNIPVIDTHKYDRYFNAILTPFKQDSLEIDEDLFREHLRRYTRDPDFLRIGGAIIVNPEAGETFYLTQEEQDSLTKITLQERPKDMPVFSGFYGVSMEEIISSALQTKSLGVDGLFVFPPTGTMEVGVAIDTAKNPEIWTDFVRAIAVATQLPLILHPAAPRTQQWGGSLAVESVRMLVEEVPSIVGYKFIYGLEHASFRVAQFLRSFPRHVAILNAPVAEQQALVLGLVDGAVSGGLNFMKEPIVEHLLAWQAGDMKKVKKIWSEQVIPINSAVYDDHSRLHIHYKIATWIRGFIPHPFMRPPMPPPRLDEIEIIFKAIDKAGLSHISRSELNRTYATKKKVLESFWKKLRVPIEIKA